MRTKVALIALGVVCALLVPAPAQALPQRCSGVLGIAHKGSKYLGHSEDTIAAFKDAVSLHADAVETDVRITKDGKFMLLHDATLDRTTTGTGYIANRKSTYVRSVHTNDGGRVPFLRDALTAMRRAGVRMFLEMKTDNVNWTRRAVRRFTSTIRNQGMFRHVVVVAPGELLPRVDSVAPRIETSWKNPTNLHRHAIRQYADGALVGPRAHIDVRSMHQVGLSVWADLSNTQTKWRIAVRRHMDGIYTDRIPGLVKWCRG
jgi:glycerophosphoryl diester phosphodiesterase